MRSLRSVIIGIAVFAMIFSLSGLAFAKMGHGAYKGDKDALAAQVKSLRDAASALQATNPDLAKGLNDLADKKEKKMQKWQESKDKHEANMKLLKDSATALQTSNPALAQELQKMSEKKSTEKEEAGKATEPAKQPGEAKP